MKRIATLAVSVALFVCAGCDGKSAESDGAAEVEIPAASELIKGAEKQAEKILGDERKAKWGVKMKDGRSAGGEVLVVLDVAKNITATGRGFKEDLKDGATKESMTLSISTRETPPRVNRLSVKFEDGTACNGNDVKVELKNASSKQFDAVLSGALKCGGETVNFEGFAKAKP